MDGLVDSAHVDWLILTGLTHIFVVTGAWLDSDDLGWRDSAPLKISFLSLQQAIFTVVMGVHKERKQGSHFYSLCLYQVYCYSRGQSKSNYQAQSLCGQRPLKGGIKH